LQEGVAGRDSSKALQEGLQAGSGRVAGNQYAVCISAAFLVRVHLLLRNFLLPFPSCNTFLQSLPAISFLQSPFCNPAILPSCN
jgi:hypothetical protein